MKAAKQALFNLNQSKSYIADKELAFLFGSLQGKSDNSRYSLVKRLLKTKKLIQIRRGLYNLTEAFGHSHSAHPFELAQQIYAPSYISLESALAYHQLIPERVHTITSVCAKRSKNFDTPLGLFQYHHLPLLNFYMETERIATQTENYIVAKPWKAILDYIYCYKKNWVNLRDLTEDLRIETEDLPLLGFEQSDYLEEYYDHSRITRFLKSIRKELKQQ